MGHDRNAIGLHPAIPAPFADIGVYKDALVRVGKRPLSTTPAFFRSTGLHIDQHRNTLDLSQHFLRFFKAITGVNLHFCGNSSQVRALTRVMNEGYVLHPHRNHFTTNLVVRQPPVIALPTGHRDRIIIENFVSDIGARHQGKADRLNTTVIVGSVPHILEHMIGCGKRSLTDPIGPLTAHVG